MTDPMPPLDPEMIELLRAEPPAPAEVRERARGRLLRAIAGFEGGGAGGGGTGGITPGALGARKAVVLAFLVGGAVGAALHAAWMKTPAERVVYVDRPPAPLPPVTTEATPSPPPGSPAAPMATQVASAPPPSSGAPSRASQLAAERAILDEARKALAQGDPARSLDRLDRHRRTFANPLLAEERDAMYIQALVKAGRPDEARARGDAFRKRFPDSLFASAVASALDSIP